MGSLRVHASRNAQVGEQPGFLRELSKRMLKHAVLLETAAADHELFLEYWSQKKTYNKNK